MADYNDAISRELNQQLWHTLAACDEEEEELSSSMQSRRSSSLSSSVNGSTVQSRPLTGMKDSTGREIVFGRAKFHAATTSQIGLTVTGSEMNLYQGESSMGIPHGRGAKKYSKTLAWDAILLAYGSILNNDLGVGPGVLISTERYSLEVGVLQRFGDSIVIANGVDRIQSFEHCSKMLERLKHIQKYGAIALILVCDDDEVLNKIASEAMFSSMLEHFTIPVVGITAEKFSFLPKDWPHPDAIEQKYPALMADPPSFETTEEVGSWVLEPSDDNPMSIRIQPKGRHFRDKRGCFPIEPIGLLKVVLTWSGTELYVGTFSHGKKHGVGAYVRANGEKMVANFEGGYAHGKGYLYWPNGDMFIGNWLHGKQVGKGELRTKVLVDAARIIQLSFRMHLARRHFLVRRINVESKRKVRLKKN